jgi:quercetin dioxygenase-like cupin family protein
MLSSAGRAEEIRLPGIVLRILIDGTTTGESLTMFEMDVPAGSGMPVPHHHVGFDEAVYAMAGKLRMTVDGQVFDLSPSQSLLIKRGEIHAFSNPFDDTAKVLCVLTPGILGAQYFREVRELLMEGGPPDPAKMSAIMMRHGLVPAMPLRGPQVSENTRSL